MGLANGPNSDGRLDSAASYYVGQAVEHYHAAAWSAALAAILLLAVVAGWRRLRPGGPAVLALLILGAALTLAHPNRKSRFLHSWIAAGWTAAGAGIALAAGLAGGGRCRRAAFSLAGCATAAIVIGHTPSFAARGRSPESGHLPGPSSLKIAEAYLPWLKDARQAAILATLPVHDFGQWTYQETFPDRDLPDTWRHLLTPSADLNRERFDHWLATSPVDRIVLLQIHPGSVFHFSGFEHYGQLSELMDRQAAFQARERRNLPELGCTATLWVRSAPIARSSEADAGRR
jgi:hypothetical protein